MDRVQKKLPLPDETIRPLRRGGLIEGRKPNLHVSAVVANLLTNLRRSGRIRNTGSRKTPQWELAE